MLKEVKFSGKEDIRPYVKEVKFIGKEGIRPYVKGGQISFEKEANILMIKEVTVKGGHRVY